jgi:hypothetical protein
MDKRAKVNYDIFDDQGKLISSCVTNKEFQDLFSLAKNTNARMYVRKDMKVKGKYTVKVNANNVKVKTAISMEYFTEKMLKEWLVMNNLYLNHKLNSVKQNRKSIVWKS